MAAGALTAGRPARGYTRPMFLLIACASPPTGTADLVLQGGTVYTMDEAKTAAGAIAVQDGAIVYVGDDASAYVGPGTSVVELAGHTVLPGFHDAHTHLIWSGADLLMVDLYAATTVAELQSTVSDWASAHPDEAWVQGGGWDTSAFYGVIDKSTLDAVVSDRPAYVYSADSHIGLASTLALAEAGITADTPDPIDGTIERDEAGAPTGVLLEGAMSLVDTLIPPYSDATVDEGLANAQTEANSYGVTSINDANVADWMLAGYARADADHRLTVRVSGAAEVDPGDTDAVARLTAWQAEYTSDRVHLDAAKLYLDGIIESETAYMLEPYEDGTNFTPYFTDAELGAVATQLDAAGFQLHAHAIGDGAVRQFLDTIEVVETNNGPRDRRPLAAHLEVVDPADIPRFGELGVYADFQALWAYPDSYIQDYTWPVIGEERSEWLYPIGPVVDAGGTFVGGSDWSVTSQNPLLAIEVAVTRQEPAYNRGPVLVAGSAVDVLTAMRAYTSDGARASFDEETTGTIEVGKRADLVVLGRDPFAVDPSELSEIRVRQTYVDGELVYDWSTATERVAAPERRAHTEGR